MTSSSTSRVPRLSGLVLNADGTRLVTSVATLDAKKTKFVTALWEVDPTGEKPARRLTRSAKGESSAAFTSDGDLLFTSARPDPDGDDGATTSRCPALWLLPRDGAEARVVADRAAGLGGVHGGARRRRRAGRLGRAAQRERRRDDEKLRKARKEKKVAAILHDGYPVRFWDHDLGPESPHLFVAELGTDVVAPLAGAHGPAADAHGRDARARARRWSSRASAISPDGRTVVTGWNLPLAKGEQRGRLVAIDVASGEHRVLVDDPGADLWSPGRLAGRAVGRVRARDAVDAARRAARHAPGRPARRRRARARSSRAGTAGRRPRSGCRTARACS